MVCVSKVTMSAGWMDPILYKGGGGGGGRVVDNYFYEATKSLSCRRFQNHLPGVQINSRYVFFHHSDSLRSIVR